LFPLILTNPSHAPADALMVIDLKHNLARSMDLLRWAEKMKVTTLVETHPFPNMLSEVIILSCVQDSISDPFEAARLF
jgi:hypothetical protein